MVGNGLGTALGDGVWQGLCNTPKQVRRQESKVDKSIAVWCGEVGDEA